MRISPSSVVHLIQRDMELIVSSQADLESVIMIGGSSRVPMVEAAVRAIVGEDKLAKNVNADEAAVMGTP